MIVFEIILILIFNCIFYKLFLKYLNLYMRDDYKSERMYRHYYITQLVFGLIGSFIGVASILCSKLIIYLFWR